ncbi:MAG: hypothetical protein ACR2MD_05410 [Aridibacter sp.]
MINKVLSLNDKKSRKNSKAGGWGLKGYRPSTAFYMDYLSKLHTDSFFPEWTKTAEIRGAALWISNPDFNFTHLKEKLERGDQDLIDMLAFYRISYETRDLIDLPIHELRSQEVNNYA